MARFPLHGEFLIRFTNSSDCDKKTILIKIIPIYCENYFLAPYRISGILSGNRAVPELFRNGSGGSGGRRFRSRKWLPPFPPARSTRLQAAVPPDPLSLHARFARSRVAQQRYIRPPSGLPGPARVHADFRQRFPFKNVAAYQAHPSVSKYRNSWFAETPSQEITPNPGNPMKNNTLPIKNEPSRERLPRPVRIKEKQPGMHLSSLLPALQVAKILQANFLSFSHGHFWFLQFIRLR